MIPEPKVIAEIVDAAVRSWDHHRPRSAQARDGVIGPSSLGFCRQFALLTLSDVADSDPDNTWAATLGTLIGDGVEQAMKRQHPDWLVGSIDKTRIKATFPNGASISGTPDVVIPDWNAVLDNKTKDGFAWVRREPWSQNYRYQVWTYVLGCFQSGLLDPTRPAHMGLIYWDRSGKQAKPYVVTQQWDPLLEDEITAWIDDVIYARLHNEDASRDIPAPVCEQICSKYTVCRGALPDAEATLIEDEHLRLAIRTYVEARDDKKEAEEIMRAASQELSNVSGTDGTWQVRWTDVGGADVPGYFRHGYRKLDVRRARQR